jgi:hypothetical protein
MPIDGKRSFEVYKTWLGIASSTVLALVGLLVSYVLATSARYQEAEAKRIEYRVKFYKNVATDIDALYSFVCRVGNYSLTTPSAAGAIKRELDGAFVINLPFMSSQTFGAYQTFIGTFVEPSGIEGRHFKFRMLSSDYDLAYKNRQQEFKDRGGKSGDTPPEVSKQELDEWFVDLKVELRNSAKVREAYADLLHRQQEFKDRGGKSGDTPPEVSKQELDEWFVDLKVKPRNSAKVREAYADLLHSFGDDSGFGSTKIDSNRLSCF